MLMLEGHKQDFNETDIGRLLHQLVTGDRTNPDRLDLVLPHHTRDIGLKTVVA
jgi:hypothetical protein